jgi:hypothetical protein
MQKTLSEEHKALEPQDGLSGRVGVFLPVLICRVSLDHGPTLE